MTSPPPLATANLWSSGAGRAVGGQMSTYDALSPEALRGRRTAKWNTYDDDVLALWLAEMDFPTASVVRTAIHDAVDREEFGYPSPDAITTLAQATAEWASNRYGWEIDPNQVHVIPDVLKGVELAVGRYSAPGSPMVLLTPAYMPFFEVPKVVDRPMIEVPMSTDAGRYVLDLDGIDAAFGAGARTLILCNPYNPLGRSFSTGELRELSSIVARHGARVVSDEIHAPLTYDRVHIPYASVSPQAAEHSITLVSASKAWNLAGLRCAQAIITNNDDERRWQQIPPLSTHGASTIGIDASIAAYRLGATWLDETLAYLDVNRRLLAELLAALVPAVRYSVPEATYLAWLDFGDLQLPLQPAEYFLEHARVALNPGLAFGPNGAGCARLNFGTSAAILEQAITAIATAVEHPS